MSDDTHGLRFDDASAEAPAEVVFELVAGGAQLSYFNLGVADAFWLGGRATPPPATAADLSECVLELDERTMCESVRHVFGVDKSMWHAGSLSAPPIEIAVEAIDGEYVVLSANAELDWDHMCEGGRPPDYATHRFGFRLRARVVTPS